MTRSEMLKDAAIVALATATVTSCNKNGKGKILSGTILTAAITIVTADILIAVTRKNNKEET